MGFEFNTYIVVLDHPNFWPLEKKHLHGEGGDMVAWNPIRIQALGFGEIWYQCGSTSPSYFVLNTLKISRDPKNPKRKKF